MTHEDFVTYEQAKTLKDLGFDWECNHWYHIDEKILNTSHDYANHNVLSPKALSAPTLNQAQKWLREVKGIKVYIKPLFSSEEYEYCISFKFRGYGGDEEYGVKKTWESALSAGINEAIKLLKKEEQRKKRWYE